MAKQSNKKPGPKKAASKATKLAMPKWEKPSDEISEKFYSSLPDDKRVEPKKMFGFPCAFVNGNMCVGIFNQDIMVRLSEADRKDWIENKEAHLFEPIAGRPMKEYIQVPKPVLQNLMELKKLVQQSFNYVLTLEPKEKKKK